MSEETDFNESISVPTVAEATNEDVNVETNDKEFANEDSANDKVNAESSKQESIDSTTELQNSTTPAENSKQDAENSDTDLQNSTTPAENGNDTIENSNTDTALRQKSIDLQTTLQQYLTEISGLESQCQKLTNETTSLNEYIESLMAKR